MGAARGVTGEGVGDGAGTCGWMSPRRRSPRRVGCEVSSGGTRARGWTAISFVSRATGRGAARCRRGGRGLGWDTGQHGARRRKVPWG